MRIYNESQLEEFYASGCDEINGKLEISGTSLSSLVGLNHLRVVRGELMIKQNNNLTSLADLRNLTTVSEAFIITQNNALDTLNLESLRSVGGLTISSNPNLQSLSRFRSLSTIGRHGFIVTDSSSLTDIGRFDALRNISFIRFVNLPVLSSLQGIRSIQNAERGVEISETGLSQLDLRMSSIGGWLKIDQNHDLQGISLSNLSTIGADLNINSNDSLYGFNFQSLREICADPNYSQCSFTVLRNPQLSQCLIDELLETLRSNGFRERVASGQNQGCP